MFISTRTQGRKKEFITRRGEIQYGGGTVKLIIKTYTYIIYNYYNKIIYKYINFTNRKIIINFIQLLTILVLIFKCILIKSVI